MSQLFTGLEGGFPDVSHMIIDSPKRTQRELMVEVIFKISGVHQ